MTLTIERDDGTTVAPTDVRAALAELPDYAVAFLTHGDGRELAVGLRAGRGACYFVDGPTGDPVVSAGGTNSHVEVYGVVEIPFPPGAELDAGAVTDAAAEFARTGKRPTCVEWKDYFGAFPLESTITPEELQELVNGGNG